MTGRLSLGEYHIALNDAIGRCGPEVEGEEGEEDDGSFHGGEVVGKNISGELEYGS
jgi:hypothetical protein